MTISLADDVDGTENNTDGRTYFQYSYLYVIHPSQECVRTQADQPCEGRFYAVLHLPEQNVGHSHRLFDIFTSAKRKSGGAVAKKSIESTIEKDLRIRYIFFQKI